MTQTSFQSVHGTTDEGTVFCFYTIFYRQCCFTEFCCHTKQTCKPHPEYSTGAACADCSCNTYDITGTDGSRKCCCQRTEARYVTACLRIRCNGKLNRCNGFSLNDSCSECQINVCTYQQDQHDRPPHKAIDFCYKSVKSF